ARRLLRTGDMADAVAALVAQAARHRHLAKLAGTHKFNGLADARLAADLRAGLADLAVMPRRLHDAPAFPDVVADRLLDINVLARLHGPDGGQRVPVIRRRDADGVDRFIVHDAPQILHDARLGALAFHGELHRGTDHGGIDVAKMRDDTIVPAGITGDVAAAL